MDRLQAGWRISIKGKTSKEDIAAQVLRVLGELEAAGGIHEYSGINVYVNLYRNGKRVAVVDQGGLIGGLDLVSEKSHAVVDPSDKNVVRYKTEVDFARLQNKASAPSAFNLRRFDFIDFDDYELQVKERARVRQTQRDEHNRQRVKEHDEYIKERTQKENRLKAFKLFLIERHSVGAGEFAKRIPSSGEVTSKAGKLKYLDAGHQAVSGIVFRATIRSTTGTTKSVEIFDVNHVLLNVISDASEPVVPS